MNRKMKDSGVAWIGDIPEEWNIAKIKHYLRRSELRNPRNVRLLSLYREYGVIPKDSRSDNHNVASENTDNYKYVRPGDFVINKMKAWQGSVAVSEYEGIVSPAYYVYVFLYEIINKRYFHYLLRSCYKDEFRRLSGGLRVGQWDLPSDAFENTLFLLPPCIEQVAIAKSLDTKCAEIDKVVEKTRKSIEEYKKLKQAVITEAMTKGVRGPRPMKPSGVEWIGDIPEEWEITRIKYRGEYRNGLTYKPEDVVDNGVLVMRSSNIQNGKIELKDNVYVNCEVRDELMINRGDILICSRNGSRELIGKNAIIESELEATFGAFMMRLRSKFSRYMYYILNSDVFAYYLNSFMTSTINQLTCANFGKMQIPWCPAANEQQEIANYLDAKCGEIDRLISKKGQLIAEMEAYKKSLIYEYVTGKKEVLA